MMTTLRYRLSAGAPTTRRPADGFVAPRPHGAACEIPALVGRKSPARPAPPLMTPAMPRRARGSAPWRAALAFMMPGAGLVTGVAAQTVVTHDRSLMTCAPNSHERATKPNSRPAFPQVPGWSTSTARQEDSASCPVAGHGRGFRHSRVRPASRPRRCRAYPLSHRGGLVSTSLSKPVVMKASRTISDGPLSTTSAPLGRTAPPIEENDPKSGTADVVHHFPVEAAALRYLRGRPEASRARPARASRRPSLR